MKKFAIFILALLYLGTSSGASVNIHYCMGEFAGWDLGHEDAGACESCGMEKSSTAGNDCCKDEHKLLKVKDVHKSAQVFADQLQLSPSLPEHNFVDYQSFHLNTTTETYPVVNAPPPSGSLPVFLFIRSIRL